MVLPFVYERLKAAACIVDGQEGREYDLVDEDFDFLEKHPQFSEDELEGWIDRMEKAAPTYNEKLSPEKTASLLQIDLDAATKVWKHWRSRRDVFCKPLLGRLVVWLLLLVKSAKMITYSASACLR